MTMMKKLPHVRLKCLFCDNLVGYIVSERDYDFEINARLEILPMCDSVEII